MLECYTRSTNAIASVIERTLWLFQAHSEFKSAVISYKLLLQKRYPVGYSISTETSVCSRGALVG
jgi:hypothetical protein